MNRSFAALCCLSIAVITSGAFAQPAPAVTPREASGAAAEPLPITLDRANLLLLERNRDLRAAQRRIEGARADIVIAGQRPNPTLSVGASTPFRTELDSRVTASGIGARLEQLIERGNKRDLRVAVAEQALFATTADLAEIQRGQRLLVANALFALKQAEQRVLVNRDLEALLERLLSAMELRLKAGDIAPSDLSRVRVELLRARNETLSSEGDRRQAQTELGYLVGLEQDSQRLRADEPWPPLPEGGQVADPGVAIDARADMRAAMFRLSAAERNRDLARALRTRDVVISAGVDRSMPEGGPAFGSIGISVPLFANHRFEGEIQRAESDLYAARDEVERIRASAVTEVTRARAALVNAALRSARYRNELLVQAERSAAAIEFAYRNGAVGLLDLLDARRTLQSTRLDATDAEADFARAAAAWRAVTQAAGDAR